ncbi:DNA-directed RNA polymerase subunit H [Candidatus Woesearchaeota archaeon]|nr:DNA-directed RNA polymerase subunit H [Candidatus Woesearchaeota archaeon]
MSKIDITQHVLVPKHSKVSEKEKKELLQKYSLTLKELPKILSNDTALKSLDVQEGDVVKIERNSLTAGKSIFYRRVAL